MAAVNQAMATAGPRVSAAGPLTGQAGIFQRSSLRVAGVDHVREARSKVANLLSRISSRVWPR